MSQQTQIERVRERWERWIARWPTAEALAAASLAEVLRDWQGLGYPRRARDLLRRRAADRERRLAGARALTELPGVGPYTADAIRCFAFEEPVLPRDANVRPRARAPLPGRPRAAAPTPWALGGRADGPRPRRTAGRGRAATAARCARGCLVALDDAGLGSGGAAAPAGALRAARCASAAARCCAPRSPASARRRRATRRPRRRCSPTGCVAERRRGARRCRGLSLRRGDDRADRQQPRAPRSGARC